MLDKDKVKKFWDSRAKTYESLAFESIANLEQHPDNLKLKIEDETKKVFAWLGDINGKRILDLGAGVGQWAFRFIERGASKVTAVEFSEELANIGSKEAQRKGIKNLEFIVSPAELFDTEDKFDIVFCSGLCVYLNDDQFEGLAKKLPQFLKVNGVLMLREGMAIKNRHEINDRFSEHLQTNYSATYRTESQYLSVLDFEALRLVSSENMFPEGHPLNKYPETRLHLFLFQKD